MCGIAGGAHLTKGINFRVRGRWTILLMSLAENAPYPDRLHEADGLLHYVGENQRKSAEIRFPELVDQIYRTPNGTLTGNGRLRQAVHQFKEGEAPPERALVFEKIKKGLWVFAGIHELIDAWESSDGNRRVCIFGLRATSEALDTSGVSIPRHDGPAPRAIPADVKVEVWDRDKGMCVKCGSSENLHFDHVIPYSQGGTSLRAENVQLLCSRHNLEKSDRIDY